MDTTEPAFVSSFLNGSLQTLEAFVSDSHSRSVIFRFADVITEAIRSGHKLMVAGNGGSAADAQHIAAEFVSRLLFDHAPMAALALTTDTSIITAVGNDYGFERVFERQVLGLGNRGDVLLGISTSGKSPNILNAIRAARLKGIMTLGFTGNQATPMAEACDYILCAPSDQTALIQQIHIVAAHLVCALVESRIFVGHSLVAYKE